METIIISIAVFSLSVLGLSLGSIVKGKQIKGHCGAPTLKEGCIKDSQGNKIQSCSECSCDTEIEGR